MFSTLEVLAVAQHARAFLDYEREMLAGARAELDADVAFVVRAEGLGPGAIGVRAEVARAARTRWGVYGDELAPVFAAARSARGVALDAEVLGKGLRTTRVYREILAPHGGRSTLIGVLALGGDPIGTIAIGRTRGSFRTGDLDRLASLLPALSVCDVAMRRKEVLCATLSAREREVVRCLRLGYTNAQIADALGTSVNTVRNQLRSVFGKLGATTRAEAVALSFGHGT